MMFDDGIEGRLAKASRLIAETQATAGARAAVRQAAEAQRQEAALDRARKGDLRVVEENGVDVCAYDRSVLYVDTVPYWPTLARLVCPTCDRERLMVEGGEGE